MLVLSRILYWFFPLLFPACLWAQSPVADMHLHYKWSQRDNTSIAQVEKILQEQQIVLAVVMGTPTELALQLAQQIPKRVVPIFSPYRKGGDWHRWSRNPEVVEKARNALVSGQYHGIGELHLIGGFAPREDKNTVLSGLMRLAQEFHVPILLHTEYSRPDPLLNLCQRYPDTRIVWAHAGAILKPGQVETVLRSCGNVWAGLAARDPWRFINHPITDEKGILLSEWRSLLERFPGRFMVGSDPVWPVDQMDRWDQGDTGWHELDRFWSWHRDWLEQLPKQLAHQISCENAVKLFLGADSDLCDPAQAE